MRYAKALLNVVELARPSVANHHKLTALAASGTVTVGVAAPHRTAIR